MTEQTETNTTEEITKEEEIVICYISKREVPISETIEVEYQPGVRHRVLPKYIRSDT